jgi:flavin prenyltransferase
MVSGRLVVGISGASAAIYGIRALELLRPVSGIETHLVHTRSAERTIELETDYSISQVRELADVCYESEDMAASISSGSFGTLGMIVAPCSINTLACIAGSITKDLLTRAADVTLKERRPLVLLVRESPLHLGHLRRLVEVAEMGAIIAPPIPAFYQKPETIFDLIDHSVGRALDALGLDLPFVKRWSTPESSGR